jgi:hypothetical protein
MASVNFFNIAAGHILLIVGEFAGPTGVTVLLVVRSRRHLR